MELTGIGDPEISATVNQTRSYALHDTQIEPLPPRERQWERSKELLHPVPLGR